jgi:hypothetical protein
MMPRKLKIGKIGRFGSFEWFGRFGRFGRFGWFGSIGSIEWLRFGRKRLLVPAMVLVFSLPGMASGADIPVQDIAFDDLMRMSLEDILEISVVSASKLEQRAIEAPSVINVVTREQIQQYGWMSLNDILYKQPGFGPAQDYDRRTVSSRGFSKAGTTIICSC